MAKSTRSKVKRHFRAKKREDSVYAAVEAARLHRLNSKLRALVSLSGKEDPDADAMAADKEETVDGEGNAGWCRRPALAQAVERQREPRGLPNPRASLFLLGLMDPADMTADGLGELWDALPPSSEYAPHSGPSRSGSLGGTVLRRPRSVSQCSPTGGLDHLFPSSSSLCSDGGDDR
ncbi:uncharacterized protein BXZ73DRAFT_97146 [Epithele typhae]|uniref:uncharacterized protein n=1 Tax=Epithele typhae TaxID=378194 RepID=UPI002007894E|nr:uncharacterized protein BXZ73DRAFT_97146 [Epithele typhae]KAH9943088.1 hypothetical protein BXZ73DRAFT_97146 [Epithele typhae]